MNPWQTWLQSLSQAQNSQTGTNWQQQAAQQWQAVCTQWQQSTEGAWSTPASFWQAVAGIQSARARTLTSFFQQQPQFAAQFFQCTTFPQVIECLTRWQGHTLTSIINLNSVTQAHTGNFFSQLQRQQPAQWQQANAFTNAFAKTFTNAFNNGSALNAMWKFGSTQASSQQTQGQPAQAPKSGSAATSSQATQGTVQAASQQTTVPQTEFNLTAQSTSHSSLSTQPQAAAPITHGSVAPAIISSTADSVMRSSSGSTIAAAAARRSVVARRSSSNRRRAVR